MSNIEIPPSFWYTCEDGHVSGHVEPTDLNGMGANFFCGAPTDEGFCMKQLVSKGEQIIPPEQPEDGSPVESPVPPDEQEFVTFKEVEAQPADRVPDDEETGLFAESVQEIPQEGDDGG